MHTEWMHTTNLSDAFNAPKKKKTPAHQTASYAKALIFRGALAHKAGLQFG